MAQGFIDPRSDFAAIVRRGTAAAAQEIASVEGIWSTP